MDDSKLKSMSVMNKICVLKLAATIYTIWRERNTKIIQDTTRDVLLYFIM